MNKPLPDDPSIDKELSGAMVSSDLAGNVTHLKELFTDCADVVFHPFQDHHKTAATVIYIRGMINMELLDGYVLSPLKHKDSDPAESISNICDQITISDYKELQTIGDIVNDVLDGRPVLIIDKLAGALSLGLTSFEKRSIEEPLAESVVRGPREGFIETLEVNTSLIRRRLKTPALKRYSPPAFQ